MGKWRYGVIFDAGSSGTRVHIYQWLRSAQAKAVANERDLHRLPVLKTKKKWTKKIKPGISTFSNKPELVGPEHLETLFDHALEHVPPDAVEETPVFLLATAGVRLLSDVQKKVLLAEICSFARRKTNFLLPDCDLHIKVIPGETEGLYGWIAANYLLGGFDFPEDHAHGKGHHTYGFLDMGGASAQIAFAPNATEADKHAEDLKLLRLRTLNGAASEYRVFVTTWLEYGVFEARRRYVASLLESTDTEKTKELPDPCLPAGLAVKKDGQVIHPDSKEAQGKETYLLGTGNFRECLSQTFPLLDKTAICKDPPCLLHGIHVPAIDFDVNHFVGVSEYWHTTHEIFEIGYQDKAYDFQTYQKRVTEFCSQRWSDIALGIESHKWGRSVDESTAVEVCFKASWLINMLHEGIGIPRVGIEAAAQSKPGQNTTKELLDKAKKHGYLAPFQAVNKIDDTEVSWTLGKMVLYAASQIPPVNATTLAVGFGSNVRGMIPADFQYAGGKADVTIPNNGTGYDDNDEIDWQDTLLSTSSLPRRTPGFLLFLLIIFVAMFLVCGRDRRKSIITKASAVFRSRKSETTNRRSRRRPGGKLLFQGGDKYDRILEEGDMPHPSDFELGPLSSSESDDGRSNSSGTRRTPHTGRMTPRKLLAAPAAPSNSTRDVSGFITAGGSPPRLNVVAQGVGLGLGPVGAFRTQSSDRLSRMVSAGSDSSATATGNQSRAGSRAGSPSRWRSPLLTMKENLD